MERRHFIKSSSLLGLGGVLTGCHSSSNSTDNTETPTEKNLTITYIHDLETSPKSYYDLLTQEEQNYLDTHFPSLIPDSIPHNTENDEIILIDTGSALHLSNAQKNLKNTKQTRSRSTRSTTSAPLTYESTMSKDNYAIHMFYKKINAETNPYTQGEDDDIMPTQPPLYSLASLVLIVQDDTSEDETITVNDPIRETVKALIFSTPAFQHFSRDDLYYALSKFDDIFVGKDFTGNSIPIRTSLESAIHHLGTEQWYYYQVYRDKDGNPQLRNTDSTDDNGNIIHQKGEPIYTYPLKRSLDIHLQNDLKKVIQYFSADTRIAPQLLTQQKTDTVTQKRLRSWQRELRRQESSYNGITYNMNTDPLKSEGLDITLNKVDSDGFHITASNSYNRHSSLLVVHLDQDGFPVGSISKVGILSPRYALMAIPLANFKHDYTISIPDVAHTSRFILGSLSFNNGHNKRLYEGSGAIRSRKDDIDKILTDPEAYTIAFEMAVSAIMIAWGAKLKRDASLNSLFLTLGAQFAYGIASPFFGNPDLRGKDAFFPILANMGTALLSAKNELAAVLTKAIAESEVENSVPLAGQIARAINVAVDVANLGETFYAVSTVHAINLVDVTRTHTIKLELQSDAGDNDFPLDVDSVEIELNYSTLKDEGKTQILTWDTNNIVSHSTDGGGTYSTYKLEIPDQPAGGKFQAVIKLKIGTWIAAKGILDQADNVVDEYIEVNLKENLIPLGDKSIYQHYAKLTKNSGTYQWNIKGKNTLLPVPGLASGGSSTTELLKISVNDPIGAIGYSYKDLNNNTYYVKNISAVLETPNQGTKSISRSNMMQLSYNLTTSDSADRHLLFESKNGYTFVRNININSQSTDFQVDFSKNIGMFITDTITQVAYHPDSNIIAGLDTDIGVLHILHHLEEPRDDTDTNRYLNAQSMTKTRSVIADIDVDPKTQYLYTPKLLTMSAHGDIIILEQTRSQKNRLRAFDKYGSVYLNFEGFNNQSGVFHLKEEFNSVTYLDISIESKGFIYVLKQLGADSSAQESYILDIYDPKSDNPTEPIVSTTGFSTSKIKVDHWRRVYSLNYETTEDNEPTISVWVPPVP